MQAVRAREVKEGVARIGGRRPYGYTSDMSERVREEVERIEVAADRVLSGESVWSICAGWNKSGSPHRSVGGFLTVRGSTRPRSYVSELLKA